MHTQTNAGTHAHRQAGLAVFAQCHYSQAKRLTVSGHLPRPDQSQLASSLHPICPPPSPRSSHLHWSPLRGKQAHTKTHTCSIPSANSKQMRGMGGASLQKPLPREQHDRSVFRLQLLQWFYSCFQVSLRSGTNAEYTWHIVLLALRFLITACEACFYLPEGNSGIVESFFRSFASSIFLFILVAVVCVSWQCGSTESS